MDRNLWIRIQASGAAQAGAAVRRVGQEMRMLGTQARNMGQQVRLGTGVLNDSVSKGIGSVPGRLRNIRAQIAAQMRVISQSMSQGLQSAGALNKYSGPSALTQQLRLLGMQAKTSLGVMTDQMRRVGSVIRTGVGDWTAQFRGFGSSLSRNIGSTLRTATMGWSAQFRAFGNTVGQTIRTNVVGAFQVMSSAATQHFTAMRGRLDDYRGRLFELGRDHEQAAHAIGLAFAGIGAVIIGTFALSIREAAQFQQEMQNVASVLVGSKGLKQDMKEFNDEIMRLSSILPQSPEQLAHGLYEIAQAGFEGRDALNVLQAAATAASAGLTDTVTATTGLQAVINAYGESTRRAGYISDVLFQTVRVGIISFEELAQQIGDFVGFAAAAGIRIEDLGIAMATMTRAGIPAAEAATSLNRVIQAFVKPSQAMSAEMEKLGISVDDFKNGNLRLHEAMELIRESTGGSVVQLQKLFPEIRAARGAYALMADEGKLVKEVFREFGEEADINGRTLQALEEQSKAFNYQWKITRNEFSQAAIEIGNRLLPALTDMVKAIADAVNWWQQLPTPIQNVVLVIGGFAGIAAAMAGAMFLLLPRLADTAKAMEVLGITTQATATKMGRFIKGAGIIGAALAALGLVYAIFSRDSDKARESNDEFAQSIASTGDILSSTAKDALLGEIFSKDQQELADAFKNTGVAAAGAVDAIQGVNGSAKDFSESMRAATRQYSNDIQIVGDDKVWTRLAKGIRGNSDELDRFIRVLEFQKSRATDLNASGSYDDEREGLENLIRVMEYVRDRRMEAITAAQAYNDTNKVGQETAAGMQENFLGAADAASDLAGQEAKLTESQKALNELFAEISSPGAAFKDAADKLKPLVNLTSVYSDVLSKNQEKLDAQASALNEKHNEALTEASRKAAQNARVQKRSIDEQTTASKEAAKAAGASTTAITEAAKKQKQAIEDQARATTEANSTMRTEVADFQKEARVSIDQFIKGLRDAGTKQQNYYRNINTLTQRGFGDLTDVIADGSEESANLLALLAQSTDDQVTKVAKSYERLGPSANTSFKEFIRQLEKRQRSVQNLNSNIYKLITRGQGQLVDEIMASNLDPQQQADLINQAVGATDKGLKKLLGLLATANYQGGELFAVGADKNVRIIATMVDQMNLEGKNFTLQEMFTEFRKLSGDTSITKEEFILALADMGTAIHDLPKNVQTRIKAYVEGTQQIADLNTQIHEFEEGIKNLPGKIQALARGTLGQDLQSALGEAEAKVKVGVTTMTAETVNIYSDSAPHSAARANGGIWAMANGGMKLPANALIQKPVRGLVQWAEPETGGEAFIPLAAGKRQRSTAILEDVASRFGYTLIQKAREGGIRYSDEYGVARKMEHGATVLASYAMGVSRTHAVPRDHGPRRDKVVETNTYSQPVYIDRVEAHDYDDFKRELDREVRFRSMPGNLGGRD